MWTTRYSQQSVVADDGALRRSQFETTAETITRPARAVLAENFFGGGGLAPSASRGAAAARGEWGLGSPQKIF